MLDLLQLHSTEKKIKNDYISWQSRTSLLLQEMENQLERNPPNEQKILSLVAELDELNLEGVRLQGELAEFKKSVDYYS